MKHTILFLAIGLLVLLSSCENKTKTELKEILPQYEVLDNQDTVNYLDINGLRQGHWIIYEIGLSNINASIACPIDSIVNAKPLTCSSGKCKIEEGFYKNDKKIGHWKHFNNNNGTVKDSTEYKIEV
ncbi:hypothetical protein [Aurantibacillus circumpalustris]|uniref:hypothetical protein n=1 Tax=Aurantibacillus circumpalustris TaxID=3036359 RepID=UPI00295BFED9|nr:hypothetical protein [Aurantibacillus circumpalustris]